MLSVVHHLEREVGQACTMVEISEGESTVGMGTGKKSKNRPDKSRLD